MNNMKNMNRIVVGQKLASIKEREEILRLRARSAELQKELDQFLKDNKGRYKTPEARARFEMRMDAVVAGIELGTLQPGDVEYILSGDTLTETEISRLMERRRLSLVDNYPARAPKRRTPMAYARV